MNKYLSFISFKFLASMQYRAELLVWVVLDFFPFLLLFFVFSSIYANQQSIGGLTFTSTVEYYFLGFIVQGLTAAHFEAHRSEQIRMGKIDFFLIRPFSYIEEIAWSHLASKLFYFCLFFPISIILYFLIQPLFQVQLFQDLSFTQLPVFLFLIAAAFLLQYFFGAIITLLTFWFEGAQGLQHFKWIVITLLSGAMFPVEFLPLWLQTIINALPFKFLYYVPIRVMQQGYSFTWLDFAAVMGMVIFFYAITKVLLILGIRQYSSVGG